MNVTNFGITLFSDAVVQGIQVIVSGTGSGSKISTIQLINGGTHIVTLIALASLSSNRADTQSFGSSEVNCTYGDSTDLWGSTWSVATITNTSFGFSFAGTNTKGTPVTVRACGALAIVYYYTSLTLTATVPASVTLNMNSLPSLSLWIQGKKTHEIVFLFIQRMKIAAAIFIHWMNKNTISCV